MDFLKRHYEKILLVVLLSVFIGLLAFQLVLWQQNEQIKVDELKKFEEPGANYVYIKFDDPASGFRVLETLPEKPAWNRARSREGSLNLYTDFMIPYPMALCPYCLRIIPARCFPAGDGEDQCLFPDCKKILHSPYNSTQSKEQDSDADGIPDKDELQLGLNPKDGTDAAADSDDDGFSNYEEYISKTDLKNPLKRPRYHEKLFVRSIIRGKLPFRLKNVSFNSGRDKMHAQIQVEWEDRSKRRSSGRTLFLKLNDEFPKQRQGKGKGVFKVVDVIPKFTKKANGLEENESMIVVQRISTGEKINVEIGKITYEPRIKAVLSINLVNSAKDIEVFENSKFTIGKLKTGEDKYTVVQIDQKANTVTVKFEGDGKNYVIGSKSMLQKKIDAIQKVHRPRRQKKKFKDTK